MARKLISTPKGTTAVLFKKKTYVVGDEVPDDFPDHMLAAPIDGAPAAAPAQPAAEGDGDKGKGKKKDKAPKGKGK